MAPRKLLGRTSSHHTSQLRQSLARLTGVVEIMLSEIEEVRTEQRLQFKRLAQLQAELDGLKHAWQRTRGA